MRRNFRSWHEQYFNDSTFKHLVDQLCNLIETCEITPDEVRNAATFAVIKFQERNGISIPIVDIPQGGKGE